MKYGRTKLKMADGSIRKFRSEAARDRFEKVAKAVKNNPEFKRKLAKKK